MADGLRFFRDVGNVTMDLNGVEHVQFNALGGADNDHRQRPDRHRRDAGRDRSAARRAARRRRAADTVMVNGTAGDDHISVVSSGASVVVSGLLRR